MAVSDAQLELLPTATQRANQISKAAGKRRRRKRLAGEQLALAAGLVARARRPRTSRYSPEVVRDARWPVEPLDANEPERLRHVRLRAAMVLSGTFTPSPGLPGSTRASCPADRATHGCPFASCRWHLWRVDGGPDGNRPGRPGLAQVGRDERGRTLRQIGDNGGERPSGTLEPRWLAHPVPDSCALDVAERGPQGNEQVGRALDRHRTLVARLVLSAIGEAVAACGDLGLDPEELAAQFAPALRR